MKGTERDMEGQRGDIDEWIYFGWIKSQNFNVSSLFSFLLPLVAPSKLILS